MIVGDDVGLGFVVKQIWAVLVVHDDGDEAVPGVFTPAGMVPLVAADPERLEWMKRMAKKCAEQTKKPVRIVRFETRVDEELIEP